MRLRKRTNGETQTFCTIAKYIFYMKQFLLILLCSAGAMNCVGQYKSLADFYAKMYNTKQFNNFGRKTVAETVDKIISNDTSNIQALSTLEFDKHPHLKKSSKGGRFEIYSSALSDTALVDDGWIRLYINFKSKTEGKAFLDNLASILRQISWKTEVRKTSKFEEFTFLGQEFRDLENETQTSITCHNVCKIVLRLTFNQRTNEYELYIGD
jgi:hypothetical protein